MDQRKSYIIMYHVRCWTSVPILRFTGSTGCLTHPHDQEFLAAAESGGVDEDAEEVAADDGYGIDEAQGWLKVANFSLPTSK